MDNKVNEISQDLVDYSYTIQKCFVISFTSEQPNFQSELIYFRDWLNEKHYTYVENAQSIKIYIPLNYATNEQLVHSLIECCAFVFNVDGRCDYELSVQDLVYSHYYDNPSAFEVNVTASKKYPFNACVIGHGGRPIGGVDDEVLKEFDNGYREIIGLIDSAKKNGTLVYDFSNELKKSLQLSKSKYSCNFVNVVFSECSMFKLDSKERDRMHFLYQKLENICTSRKRYENAKNIVITAFNLQGYRLVDENFRYGGQPQLAFKKGNAFYYVNSDQQSIFYLFRNGGRHQFYAEWNLDIKSTKHRVEKIAGGLNNLLKTFANVDVSPSNFDVISSKIAKKICLAYTKKSLLEFLRYKLSTDDRWALRALQRIYQGQTVQELNEQNTKELNNLGFTGFDAPILTSIYKSYLEHGKRLTPKQLDTVKKMMKKYAGQIYRSNYFDKNKMEKIYEEHLKNNLF